MASTVSQKDKLFISRTLELAEQGRGNVSPNPLVGCVIVKDNKIIGEGFHEKYGEAHAEVNAINAVENKEDLRDATLYVNLEPCSHYGKTPPCADLIIQYPFKKVVVCNHDPNPLVAGKGLEKIRAAGIEVLTGVLEEEGRDFNRRFFTFMEKKRPYIILKWAETMDGFIAKEDFSSKWISNDLTRKLVHKWRSEEDAIIVGTNTAIYDNPRLNVRDWQGRDPLRIYMDKNLNLPENSFLIDGSQPTLCYNALKAEVLPNLEYVKTDNPDLLDFIIKDLYTRRIQSVIIEGGGKLLSEVIQKGVWDEIRMSKSPVEFEKGIKAPTFTGDLISTQRIEEDELFVYRNKSINIS